MKINVYDYEQANRDVFQILLRKVENPSPFGISFVSSWFMRHEGALDDYPNLPGVEFALQLAKNPQELVIIFDASLFCDGDRVKLREYIMSSGLMNVEFISIPIKREELVAKVMSLIERMN